MSIPSYIYISSCPLLRLPTMKR